MSQVPYYLVRLSPSELLTIINALRMSGVKGLDRVLFERLQLAYASEMILPSEVTSEDSN